MKNRMCKRAFKPFIPKLKKSTFSQPFGENYISEVVRITGINIFHLSKRCKAKFFILCDVIFLVKFEVYRSWE